MERLNRKTHPLVKTWYGMLYRCFKEYHSRYKDYGGRGITVCERWSDPEYGFENFVNDMGERPEGYTLDRIDFDGDYEPSNCRWVDADTQVRNKRSTKIKGEDLPKIVEMYKSGMLQREIAAVYKCTTNNISDILSGRQAGGRYKTFTGARYQKVSA